MMQVKGVEVMNTKKTGSFLRELRREGSLTQEQLAERLNVSARTISRWETGSNLLDLDVLMALADLYQVDIRELIDGERNSENMDTETKDTLKKVADYTEQNTARLKKKIADLCMAALLLLVFCAVLEISNGFNGMIPERAAANMRGFSIGAGIGFLVLNVLFLIGKLDALQEWKLRLFRKN